MLRTHRAGKGLGSCGGWGLGSRNKGAKVCPPTRVSEGRGPHWEPSRPPVLEWVGQLPSAPLLLLLEGPSCLPLLISPASLLYPQGPMWPGGTLEGRRLAWELLSLTRLEWVGRSSSTPLLLFSESPSCLPLLISLASGVMILSGLHFSSPLSPPTSYCFTLGFLWSPRESESSTSGQQVP